MFWFILSAVLVIAGTVVAVIPLVRSQRQHAPGQDLIPPLGRARRWVQRIILRRPTQVANTVGLAAAVAGTSSVTVILGSPDVEEDAPLEDQVGWLRRRLAASDTDLQELRRSITDAERHAEAELAAARQELRRELDEVRALAAEIAVSDVRWQLWALVLIGGGSIAGLVPSLLGL